MRRNGVVMTSLGGGSSLLTGIAQTRASLQNRWAVRCRAAEVCIPPCFRRAGRAFIQRCGCVYAQQLHRPFPRPLWNLSRTGRRRALPWRCPSYSPRWHSRIRCPALDPLALQR